MIIADTLNNKIVFDIGPGDIGAGQRLVLSFLSGFAMSLVTPPKAVKKVEISRIMGNIVKYFTVYNQKGQTV